MRRLGNGKARVLFGLDFRKLVRRRMTLLEAQLNYTTSGSYNSLLNGIRRQLPTDRRMGPSDDQHFLLDDSTRLVAACAPKIEGSRSQYIADDCHRGGLDPASLTFPATRWRNSIGNSKHQIPS
jgi:hypothetical protein